MDVELFSVPNDSSEAIARRIAEYVNGTMAADKRPCIVVGYSKGAPDVQVALAQEPGFAASVAAFISVAGAVGGSPVVDALPAQFQRLTSLLQLGKCEGDLAAAIRSLSRSVSWSRQCATAGWTWQSCGDRPPDISPGVNGL